MCVPVRPWAYFLTPTLPPFATPIVSDLLSLYQIAPLSRLSTEDDYCRTHDWPNLHWKFSYQDRPASIKPGSIAGFTILAVIVAAFVGISFYLKSMKSQKKCLCKQFVQQVAKHVNLKGSVTQLNPMDLLAEFKHVDKSVKGETSNLFLLREEL